MLTVRTLSDEITCGQGDIASSYSFDHYYFALINWYHETEVFSSSETGQLKFFLAGHFLMGWLRVHCGHLYPASQERNDQLKPGQERKTTTATAVAESTLFGAVEYNIHKPFLCMNSKARYLPQDSGEVMYRGFCPIHRFCILDVRNTPSGSIMGLSMF